MGKVAVVTGGSAGIGLATAEHLVKRGWDVAIIARDETRLAEAERLLTARGGGRVLSIGADVADAQAVDRAAERVERELGPIDAWVNNAMSTIIAPADRITPKEYERVTATTYLSQVYGTLAALRPMKTRNRGVIVQVSSTLAHRAAPLQSAYCAAKFAVTGFTDALRAELIEEKSAVELSVVYLPAVNTPQSNWSRTRTGRDQVLPDPLFDPRLCARAIVDAIQNPQRELYVGRTSVLSAVAQALVPALADRQAAGMKAAQLGKPMQDRDGNLFEPVPGPAAIDGDGRDRVTGLRMEFFSGRQRDALKAVATIGLVGAGLVLGRLTKSTRRR